MEVQLQTSEAPPKIPKHHQFSIEAMSATYSNIALLQMLHLSITVQKRPATISRVDAGISLDDATFRLGQTIWRAKWWLESVVLAEFWISRYSPYSNLIIVLDAPKIEEIP